MSDTDQLYCHFHPERIALERCEVCRKPLCAYCLYYTDDGQRLCQEHAEQARALGMHVDDPAMYADQLLGAQVGADRKQKRSERAADEQLYRGNSNDIVSFVAMLIGVGSLAACCGAAYCLPVVGFALSLVALINARKAHDPRRTRRLGLVGMLTSGMLIAAVIACIALYITVYGSFFSGVYSTANWIGWPTQTAIPTSGPSPTATLVQPQITPQASPTPGAVEGAGGPLSGSVYQPPIGGPIGGAARCGKLPGAPTCE